jgi:hypothetical protein
VDGRHDCVGKEDTPAPARSHDTLAVDPGMPRQLAHRPHWRVDCGRRHAPTALITGKQIRLQRLIVGNLREQAELVRAKEPTGNKPVIDRSLPLKQLADNFHYEKSGHHFGKTCLEV